MATSTLFIDTSALVRRYVHGPDRTLVLTAMAGADAWCASALTRAECSLALRRLSAHAPQHDRFMSSFLRDWDAIWVVPVDARCLAHAAQLGARFALTTVDALQLAAADRLPRPASFLTFDRSQLPAATALGFEVLSPLA